MEEAQDSWVRNNPGKTMTIYDQSAIVREALPRANSPTNIVNGFRKAGTAPFNPNIFGDHEFAPSSVTDGAMESEPTAANDGQPMEESSSESSVTEETESAQSSSEDGASISAEGDSASTSQAGTSGTTHSSLDSPQTIQANKGEANFSPTDVRPMPKAPPRKTTTTKKKGRNSTVLTDSPEKRKLEEKQARKAAPQKEKAKGKGSVSKDSKGKGKQLLAQREWFC